MKNSGIALLVFVAVTAVAQAQNDTFDGHKWEAPYTLTAPQGWEIERFPIPISFAPKIPYKGVEDIRFTPGWGNAQSAEYWSYTFLWYLDGKPTINAAVIEENLRLYYAGLIGRNIDKRKIPEEKVFTPTTSFKKVTTHPNDAITFQGTIRMLDYMTQEPIILNCIVHIKPCADEKNKTFVLYEISPQPFNHVVWAALNKINHSFNCSKPGVKTE